MDCPQCHSDSINPDDVCPNCGYKAPPPEPASKSEMAEEQNAPTSASLLPPSGAIKMDYSASSPAPVEEENLPQWRKDLSLRLKAIKEKKESAKVSGLRVEPKTSSIASPKSTSPAPPIVTQPKAVDRPAVLKPVSKPPMPIPRQKPLQPVAQTSSENKPPLKVVDPHEIRKLIDNAVQRQSAPRESASPEETAPGSPGELFADREGKLILVSRTLSGLVDLICIVFCTGAFIIAVDFFSGIIALDGVSLLIFSLLFLLNYFVYSLFFLAASSQTIGMMITELRVVGADRRRPSMRQLIYRCFGHLASLLGLGIGLLWSLFSRESMCFHDRLSHTCVIRIE